MRHSWPMMQGAGYSGKTPEPFDQSLSLKMPCYGRKASFTSSQKVKSYARSGDWPVWMPEPVCPYQWSKTWSPTPSPVSSLYGPEWTADLAEPVCFSSEILQLGLWKPHLCPPCVYARAESWSLEASERRYQQSQVGSTYKLGSWLPNPWFQVSQLPALEVQHPSNKFLLLASACLSRQLFLAKKSPLTITHCAAQPWLPCPGGIEGHLGARAGALSTHTPRKGGARIISQGYEERFYCVPSTWLHGEVP